jgi:hypothetical protein
MKIFNITNIHFGTDRIKEFCINNFNSIGSSIKSIVTEVRSNSTKISVLESKVTESWETTERPDVTDSEITIGINTTTNKLNHSIDGGSTWYNADGTVA